MPERRRRRVQRLHVDQPPSPSAHRIVSVFVGSDREPADVLQVLQVRIESYAHAGRQQHLYQIGRVAAPQGVRRHQARGADYDAQRQIVEAELAGCLALPLAPLGSRVNGDRSPIRWAGGAQLLVS